MSTQSNYLTRLKERRRDESIRSNVVFGQTLGWCLTLIGSYYYFVNLVDSALPVLILGNFLLLVGVGTPQALELPQRILESVAGFVSGILFKFVLALFYFLLIVPMGLIYQKARGRVPFYYWEISLEKTFEGWIPKILSDEGKLIGKKTLIPSTYLAQLMHYFWKHGDLVIMPSLLIALALGLLIVFVQSTPLAPMIYALF